MRHSNVLDSSSQTRSGVILFLAWCVVACAPVNTEARDVATLQKSAAKVEAALVAPSKTVSPVAHLLEHAKEAAWYGLYMLDAKVGHARVWARETKPGEPGRIVMGTDAELRVQGHGEPRTIGIAEARYYAGEAPYGLVETHLVERSPQLTTTRKAAVDGKELVVSTLGESAPPRRIPGTQETLSAVIAMSPTSLDGLQVGRSQSVVMFEWESLKDQSITVTPRRLTTLQRAGVQTPVVELEIRYERTGLKGLSLVARGGVALQTTLGPGLVLKLEEEAIAKAEVAGLDVAASGVPVARRLVMPKEREALVMDLTVVESVKLANGPGQRVEQLSPTSVRVTLDRSPGGTPTSEELAAARGPHGPVDSDHTEVKRQAATLTADLAGDRAKAEAIGQWVFKTLRKELATHIPSASEVLKHRVGDCTEHTWLFVALARAAGLSARPVYGLMYIDAEAPSFGYHAWADVLLDGHWVAVDPTWGQFPADATHLRLGSDALGVASAMGGIQIVLPPL